MQSLCSYHCAELGVPFGVRLCATNRDEKEENKLTSLVPFSVSGTYRP